MISLDSVIGNMRTYTQGDLSKIEEAYKMAESAHKGVVRKSNEPYITHPLSVAMILEEMNVFDVDTICAALLHDVLEDTTVYSKEDIAERINSVVAELVDGVTNPQKNDSLEHISENNRHILLGFLKDFRIILIKLADRLHNMRTLQHMTPEKQIEKSRETLDIYSPLADALGNYVVKKELDDISLSYLHPAIYHDILACKETIINERLEEMKELAKKISSDLERAGVLPNDVTIRSLNPYSIFEKCYDGKQRLCINPEDIYDLLYLRVLVPKRLDCYTALGVVDTYITPIDHTIHDFISSPRINYYRGIHATGSIKGSGLLTKVKIRTGRMDCVARNGAIGAINACQTGDPLEYPLCTTREAIQTEISKLPLAETIRGIQTIVPSKFVSILLNGVMAHNQITIIDFKGNRVSLPNGATVFQYAKSVYPTSSDDIAGAVIGENTIVGLNYELNDGDLVRLKTKDGKVESGGYQKIYFPNRQRNQIII